MTTPPPIVLYPGGRMKSRPRPVAALPNVSGEDLRPALTAASEGAGIPLALALACAIAESGLDPRAERWGGSEGTRQAREAIAAGDSSRLQEIIDRAWPDISFGYGQRIVRFHYAGDRTPSVPNVLAVRRQVFENPEADLREMAIAAQQHPGAGPPGRPLSLWGGRDPGCPHRLQRRAPAGAGRSVVGRAPGQLRQLPARPGAGAPAPHPLTPAYRLHVIPGRFLLSLGGLRP